MELNGKVAVVTGAGGGLGAACARLFAARGARVVLTDRDVAAVERIAAELGTVAIGGDLTREGDVDAVARLAHSTYGDVDVWLSNAGLSGPVEPGSLQGDELWEDMWGLHVMAHVYAARAVLPSMLERGAGHLVQTASVVSLSMQPQKVAYTVTKHAALALAEWLAASFGPLGIEVTCFCPGPMLTPMLLSNDYPAGHPILTSAMSPEAAAECLTDAVERGDFLAIDDTFGLGALQSRAALFTDWLAGRTPE